ncbi:Aspartate aminotransferase [Gracilariopsis chorda]|uniref:Aspartate aminotransferase n=1 Tax=Gracilariopsis chorda TaxID=448386 RepID=A0A2V3ISN8_9FLOR|nr:Aspartate aminotransferase [Gracilariopsis chorda]|eukprot:PXF44120.1 Aspartate aminotransferase [Gracilariopsis chorda]
MGSVANFHEPLAERLGRLGTETAYAVALEAGKIKDTGKTVYPFHIGDLNFRTPKVVVDACKQALDDGFTGYCPAAGIPSLRAALADHYNQVFGLEYSASNVSIQSGGKPGIGKFLMCVCNEGDEVLFPSPGYPIYESMARFLNTKPVPYCYKETEDGFVLDIEDLSSKVTNRTKAIFLNNFQNPMGVAHTRHEFEDIAALCIEKDLLVFSDDPYYQIVFSDFPRNDFLHIAKLPGMLSRTICDYTFSKSFAMTGWRLGGVLGPKWLIDQVTKINTNDEACTTHFVQVAGVTALTDPAAAKFTKDMVSDLEERRDVLYDVLNEVPGFKAIKPKATFYMVCNVTEAMSKMEITDIEKFRSKVLSNTGVSFCTRAHFGTPIAGETEMYVRFAFSGVTVDQIKAAGKSLKPYISQFF